MMNHSKKTTKTHSKRLFLAAAAAVTAGLTFAAGSAFADHHMESESSPTTQPSGQQAAGQQDITTLASSNADFSTLVAALKAADLAETLKGEGPFTVFAPTNAAFEKLPSGTVETLLREESQDALKQILLYHVVEGKVTADQVTGMDEAETLQGEALQITTEGDRVMLNGNVRIVRTDLMASNGVIHVIDTVMIPTGGDAANDSSTPAATPGAADPASPEVPAGGDPGMGGGMGGGM